MKNGAGEEQKWSYRNINEYLRTWLEIWHEMKLSMI